MSMQLVSAFMLKKGTVTVYPQTHNPYVFGHSTQIWPSEWGEAWTNGQRDL